MTLPAVTHALYLCPTRPSHHFASSVYKMAAEILRLTQTKWPCFS